MSYFFTHLIKSIKIVQEPEVWCDADDWHVASFEAPMETSCPACLVEKGLAEWNVTEQ